MTLSDREVAVLETAEWLTKHRGVDAAAVVLTRTGLFRMRYTQILHHLVLQPEVESDPRWTLLAHEVQDKANIRSRMRAARTFDRDNVIPLRRAS